MLTSLGQVWKMNWGLIKNVIFCFSEVCHGCEILKRFDVKSWELMKIWLRSLLPLLFLLLLCSNLGGSGDCPAHSQSPNDGILKNNFCNIPFQKSIFPSELLKLPWQSPLLANTRKYSSSRAGLIRVRIPPREYTDPYWAS